MKGTSGSAWIAGLVLILTNPAWAAEPIVSDGDTLSVEGTKYRLDWIDAPEFNQICLDEKGQEWNCGLAARDALVEWIAKRTVRCDDKGPDKVHPDRRIGICFVEGKELNEWLVRQGWALNFEPYAKGRSYAIKQMQPRTAVEYGRGALLRPQIGGIGKRRARQWAPRANVTPLSAYSTVGSKETNAAKNIITQAAQTMTALARRMKGRCFALRTRLALRGTLKRGIAHRERRGKK
jgi:Staphylococcal nuclease homologue